MFIAITREIKEHIMKSNLHNNLVKVDKTSMS